MVNKNCRIVLILVLALGASGIVCAQGDLGEGEKAECVTVIVSSVENPEPVFDPSRLDAPSQVQASFSAVQVTDLLMNVSFPAALSGEGVLSLRVFTPRGHLYRQYDVPVTLDPTSSAPGTRRLDGYPYPVDVLAPRAGDAPGQWYGVVAAHLPVAGTAIVSNSLYGKWRVEGAVSEGWSACVDPAAFVITE